MHVETITKLKRYTLYTYFLLQTAEKHDPDQNQCQSSETETNLSPSLETGSIGAITDLHDDIAHDDVLQTESSSKKRCVNYFELSK